MPSKVNDMSGIVYVTLGKMCLQQQLKSMPRRAVAFINYSKVCVNRPFKNRQK